MSNTELHIDQHRRIRSFTVNKDELRKMLELLQERALGAAAIEKTLLVNREEWTDEQFSQAKTEIEDGFKLYITLSGVDGRKLTGDIAEIFDSPNFPEEVKEVFFDTDTPLKVYYKYIPHNKIVLFIDFGRPDPLNFSILPSQETQNESNIEVSGKNATWVNGVFQEFSQFVDQRPSTIPWLHRHSIYDLLLWIGGFPISFWICYKLSRWIEALFGAYSPFLRAAFYFYIFIVSLSILRVVFHYGRWIWPLTEYQSPRNKSIRHKGIFTSIAGAILLPAMYDLIKYLIF